MLKQKKCKNCLGVFIPERYIQSCCGFECSIEWAKKLQEKKRIQKANKVKKVFKENDKSTLMQLAQTLVNKYVRLRDKGKPCISCDYVGTDRQIHASHYKNVGGHQQLRFYTLNIWAGCSICNNYLSGNLVPYRVNLINKIGLEKVEWLESNQERGNYSVEYLQRLIKAFRKKIKLYETKFRS